MQAIGGRIRIHVSISYATPINNSNKTNYDMLKALPFKTCVKSNDYNNSWNSGKYNFAMSNILQIYTVFTALVLSQIKKLLIDWFTCVNNCCIRVTQSGRSDLTHLGHARAWVVRYHGNDEAICRVLADWFWMITVGILTDYSSEMITGRCITTDWPGKRTRLMHVTDPVPIPDPTRLVGHCLYSVRLRCQ